MGASSLVTIPVDAKAWIVAATPFLLSIALAAMGLETNIGKLTANSRPLSRDHKGRRESGRQCLN
jgi:uncharacterized membrane protein YadS